MAASQDRIGSPSTRSPSRRSARRSPTRARSTSTSSTPSRRGGSWTAWSATRSARCCRARFAAACRPGGSSRSRSAWSSSASARSTPSPRASTGRSRRSCRRPPASAFAAELVRIDGAALDVADADGRRTARAAIRQLQPGVTKVGTRTQKRSPGPAVHHQHPPAGGQPHASASARSGRCRSPSGCTRASRRSEGQVGLITYMRTDSTAIAGVAMGEAREVIGERYGATVHDAQGSGLQDEVQGRPGGARVDPPDQLPARPGLARSGSLKPEELRLYRLIWQRALASQMAPKELETTTDRAGGRRLRAARVGDQGPVRRLRPGLHRGSRRRADRR